MRKITNEICLVKLKKKKKKSKSNYLILKITELLLPGVARPARGATPMARGGIMLVHGLTKSTLITYYSGMKKDPKYALLHAFFLIYLSCSFQNLSIWPKHTLFSNFARFCTPKRCTRVQCLVLKNNPNYVNFWTSLIPPLTFEWPPRVDQAGHSGRQEEVFRDSRMSKLIWWLINLNYRLNTIQYFM